jgi:hypothetical protein
MGARRKPKSKKNLNARLYRELSKVSRAKETKSFDGLTKDLDQQLEKTLSFDLEIIFQRRLREDTFC